MMKKYLMNGLAILGLGLVVASCSKETGLTEADYTENAEKVFGVKIDPNHDWNMTQEVNAEVKVNKGTGQTYTCTFYSNNPITESTRIYVAKDKIADGRSLLKNLVFAKGQNQIYVGLTDSKNYTIFKLADIIDGKLSVTFGTTDDSKAPDFRRSVTINGDNYANFSFPTDAELTAAYPKSIPSGAEEVVDLQSMDKYKTEEYNNAELWWIYYKNGAGFNYQVTKTGEATIGGGWKNEIDDQPATFNVYVSVNGDVTLKRSGTEHLNLYILSGNVTLDSNWGECGGIISVAAGATLNDTRDHIAHNSGIKLFNRGTVNATNSWHYQIGNKAIVFNEGTFVSTKDLVYNAGAGNTSYFYNYGEDAVLEAPAMELNSTCNFLTEGTVNISGDTKVTQEGIVWVNNGKYTTGSLKFSAKNCTFYNYCQLYVTGVTLFTDGEFNMMAGSYAEMYQGLFNNFIVNMLNNSTIYIKNGTQWGRQADGTYQGFRTKNASDVAYVKLGGTNYIPVQQEGALRFYGANMTFACESMLFFEYTNGINQYSTWNPGNYWGETNQQALNDKKDPRIEYNPGNASIATYNELSITSPEEGSCSATTEEEGEEEIEETPQIYTYAFEDTFMGDYDMNDVVIQVWEDAKNSSRLNVKLCCTGASYNLTVHLGNQALFNGKEVHQVLGGNAGKFINTGNSSSEKFETTSPVTTTIDKPSGFNPATADFWIDSPAGEIHVGPNTTRANSQIGNAPYAVMIPKAWAWPLEWTPVNEAYPNFADYAADSNANPDWYYRSAPGKTYSNYNN